MEDECVFCKIVKGDVPSEKVEESENFIVIKDINPFTDGHSLVIPKKHYHSFLDFPLHLSEEFMKISKDASYKLMKETGSGGFNLHMSNFKVAQQEVPHLHLHIIPRKEGDGRFDFLKE